MRWLGVSVLALSVVLVSRDPLCGQPKKGKKELAAKELAALQGTWSCVRWEQNGKVMPEGERQKVRVVVTGGKYKSTTDGTKWLEGKLVVDPTVTPHHMEGTFEGGVHPEIYVRAGDYMILCVGAANGPFPTEFVSSPELDAAKFLNGSVKGGRLFTFSR